nr:bifunctional pyr operon transcriptional regulator/uracil phosphoribosyltransferase PyrR [Nodosilinea sp. LEGE 07088]
MVTETYEDRRTRWHKTSGQVNRWFIERDIGGDQQRITSQSTSYSDQTFKHLLLPVWMATSRLGHYNASYSESLPPSGELPVSDRSTMVEILSAEDMRRTLNRMASEVVERGGDLNQLVLLGIYTRGVPLAHLLAQHIQRLEGLTLPVGAIDITLYRDDLDKISTRTPALTQIPFDITDQRVVLVDDVIFSGRTIRAALNAVIDYGRPSNIRLAVLIDRGHRELPIHPDFVGKVLPTAKDESVKVFLQDVDERDGVELLKPE